jgi:glycosyltransferase involved in cell wall biosynthesis
VLRRRHPDIRLVFLGAQHPNPRLPAMRVAADTRALVTELGLEAHVLFNETWVPYDERGAYLLEADLGVSTHLDHVETAFSFRTRILDYLWAGLPVVATDGDVFAAVLTGAGAGTVVPPGDVEALVAAIEHYAVDLPARRAAAAAARALAADYVWDRALAPLTAFCRAPRRAPDLLDATVRDHLQRPAETVRAPTPGPPGWRGEVALAQQYLADGGAGLLAQRALTRAGKLLRGRTD